MYYEGQGVPHNYAEAIKLWKLAAEQGHEEAVKWYRLSAKQGDADGQCGLGEMYYGGEGVPQDYAEAIKLWKLAAEQGHEEAQYNLDNYA